MSITRFDLELYLLDELDAPRREQVQAALDSDPDLAKRLERLRAEVDIPVPVFVPPSLQVPEPANRPWRWAVGIAVAAAVGITVLVSQRPERPQGPQMTYRGAMALDAQIVRNGVISNASSVIRTHPGDLLQWRILSDTDGHLTVVDQQDDGVWAVWKSAPVTAGISVEGTVRLDGYEGAERIWFVLTDAPFHVNAVMLPASADITTTDRLSIQGIQRTLLLTGAP
jgi:anti-sigma factor RsiW